MIAALYVERGGAYYGLHGVDPWDIDRDARKYDGPYPVVAHPPCQRWGNFYAGSPLAIKQGKRKNLGDDDGCFEAALASVRAWGGVLEHPENSRAWAHFGLNKPYRHGGWVVADWHGGWTCRVEQGAYGHRARKATWLYAVGCDVPSLAWGRAPGDFVRLDRGYHSAEERRRGVRRGGCERLSKTERAATPIPFRDLLLDMARSAVDANMTTQGDANAIGNR